MSKLLGCFCCVGLLLLASAATGQDQLSVKLSAQSLPSPGAALWSPEQNTASLNAATAPVGEPPLLPASVANLQEPVEITPSSFESPAVALQAPVPPAPASDYDPEPAQLPADGSTISTELTAGSTMESYASPAWGGGCCDGGCMDCCSNGICDCDCWKCRKERKKAAKLKGVYSTCDMIPHYPYHPEQHGYFYFRPYNYINVARHQSEIVQLGGVPTNPYSVSMFASIYRELGMVFPAAPASEPLPEVLGDMLPDLEDLIEE